MKTKNCRVCQQPTIVSLTTDELQNQVHDIAKMGYLNIKNKKQSRPIHIEDDAICRVCYNKEKGFVDGINRPASIHREAYE